MPQLLETDVDDNVLVARVRAGDDDAFAVLARRHHGWLVATCQRHLGGDHHQAQDLAQECLIRLHSAVSRDDRDLRVRGWLAVVARHLCIDHLRRRTPQPVEEVPDTAVVTEDPFDVDPVLATAWDRLAPRHREVLTHRELVGLSYDEVALAMGTSVPAVETLLFRARASLRTHYKRAGGRLLGCGAYLLGLDRLARGPHADPTVVEHVAGCAACRTALTQVDAVSQVLRGVPPPLPGRGGLLPHSLTRLAEHVSSALNPAASFGGQVGTALTAAVVALTPVAMPAATHASVAPAGATATAQVTPSPVPAVPGAPAGVPTPVDTTPHSYEPSGAPSWPSARPPWSPRPAPSWGVPLLGYPWPTPSQTPWGPWPEPSPAPSHSWPAPPG